MKKYVSFESDYITGAHPEILKRLSETNTEVLTGYGTDIYTESAKEKIKRACNCSDAEVFFVSGGTQTNAVVISTMLKSYEGVISCDTGHIHVHEAGAVEYTGHKVIALKGKNGKLIPKNVSDYIKAFYKDPSCTHMAYPGMVYISHPTEYGTLYTKSELQELSEICREYKIPLFMDGARLGYGLMSDDTDVTLEDVAKLCDVFYIGGTKMGALCGEAVVFTGNSAPACFMTMVKQRGAMLAKGRLLGVQFDALFTDDLYFKIGKHGIETAKKLKEVLKNKGYELYMDSHTNQQFPVVSNKKLSELDGLLGYSLWERLDSEHSVIRLATCWSTTDDDIYALEELL